MSELKVQVKLDGRTTSIHYYHEKNRAGLQRHIVLVYQWQGDTIKYGACVHRVNVDEKCPWTKRPHRSTALERFFKRPVVVFAQGWKGLPKKQLAILLRKQLFIHGCCAPKELKSAS